MFEFQMQLQLIKKTLFSFLLNAIILIFSLTAIGCKKSRGNEEQKNRPEPIPETFINRDKKMGIGNEPDESAALPFCQDSSEIPKYKKRICALKILSNHLIDANPTWKSITGVVYLRLTIDADSTLSEVQLSEDFTGQKIGEEVARKCFEYLRNYKCIPAKKQGLRIKSRLIIPIYFGLHLLDKDVVE